MEIIIPLQAHKKSRVSLRIDGLPIAGKKVLHATALCLVPFQNKFWVHTLPLHERLHTFHRLKIFLERTYDHGLSRFPHILTARSIRILPLPLFEVIQKSVLALFVAHPAAICADAEPEVAPLLPTITPGTLAVDAVELPAD